MGLNERCLISKSALYWGRDFDAALGRPCLRFCSTVGSRLGGNPVMIFFRSASTHACLHHVNCNHVSHPHDISPLLDTVFAEYAISQIGLAWYPAWPPVIGMEFEVDVRSVRTELVIDAR